MAAIEPIDFEAAERFLATARVAHEQGDERLCLAACKMVAIALCLTDSPRVSKLHTGHLQPDPSFRSAAAAG